MMLLYLRCLLLCLHVLVLHQFFALVTAVQRVSATDSSVQPPKGYQIGLKSTVGTESFQYFKKVCNPKVPPMQREVVQERIDEFYRQILQYRGVTSCDDLRKFPVPFLNFIHIAKFQKDFYIMDGQHRYRAYDKYYNASGIDFNIAYVLTECKDKTELKAYFRSLNDNFNPDQIIFIDDELDAQEQIKAYIKTHYDKHVSNSDNPRFPNINLNNLVLYLLKEHAEVGNDGKPSYSNIFSTIERLNKETGDELAREDPKLFDKAMQKQGLFLGYLFTKKATITSKAKQVPEALRKALWKNNFKSLRNTGQCYVCRTEINFNEDYEAGHIVALSRGGAMNLHNLRPVCSSCNKSCGSMNMEEFKNKHFDAAGNSIDDSI